MSKKSTPEVLPCRHLSIESNLTLNLLTSECKREEVKAQFLFSIESQIKNDHEIKVEPQRDTQSGKR